MSSFPFPCGLLVLHYKDLDLNQYLNNQQIRSYKWEVVGIIAINGDQFIDVVSGKLEIDFIPDIKLSEGYLSLTIFARIIPI